MRTPSRLALPAVLSLTLLLGAGCGDEPEGTVSDSSTTATTAASDASSAERECTADDITLASGADFGEKPEVTLPDDCTPPTTLVTEDLIEGSGPAAEEGGTVEANYLLVTWSDGVVLDNSFDRGQTYPVTPLGSAPVIEGWNQGLIGMKEGGRRLIIIPPDLGYGAAGSNGVAPNETLVFVVDAVSVS